MSERPFDIALFGATGFAGRLVAEYIAKSAPPDLRWCMAGRSKEKLERVRGELGLSAVPTVVADSHDARSLEALVRDAHVVCTTVGPFAQHGAGLVRAAARSGTHYCDITGEPTFVRRSIDDNHDAAMQSGARIVHCCGFDSIPFDLGVCMLWDHAMRSEGTGLRWAKGFAGETKGGFSGGTLSSIAFLMEEAMQDREVRRLLGDPHGLDPRRGTRTTDPFEHDPKGVAWDADLGSWTAPFLMSAVNTRIVRRSDALREGGYGAHFRYREAMSFPRGPKGLALATAVTGGLAGLTAVLAFGPTRRLAVRAFVKPGEGPSAEERARGYFRVRLACETEKGTKLFARVEGTSDPGYGETAKMLGESALCLARDGRDLPAAAGVLTPATAMGMRLVERLRRAGMTFRVDG
jgi:short subunit dehydrogenase-like uncharacterized protein